MVFLLKSKPCATAPVWKILAASVPVVGDVIAALMADAIAVTRFPFDMMFFLSTSLFSEWSPAARRVSVGLPL